MRGKLEEVSQVFSSVYETLLDTIKDPSSEIDGLRMLIPNKYVFFIIGYKGLKIQELRNNSGGANIIIDSKKEDEVALKDCVLRVIGTHKAQCEVFLMILRQLEFAAKRESNP